MLYLKTNTLASAPCISKSHHAYKWWSAPCFKNFTSNTPDNYSAWYCSTFLLALIFAAHPHPQKISGADFWVDRIARWLPLKLEISKDPQGIMETGGVMEPRSFSWPRTGPQGFSMYSHWSTTPRPFEAIKLLISHCTGWKSMKRNTSLVNVYLKG